MSHNHSHDRSNNNLRTAFFLNLAFTIFELVGGIYTNSVAIISDAIHDFGDSLSLGTAWYLDHKSKQKADKNFSFGYARFSLLGALLNSIIIIAGSIFIISEAIKRIQHPEPSYAKGMIFFAIVGIMVNGYAAWKMSGGKSLNEKVVSWHLVEDTLGWVAILIVAIILQFKQIDYLDPILSLMIMAYILWGTTRRLKETLFIFLQGTPKEIDVLKIEKQILSINTVLSVHHTHVWSLEGEHHVFSTHIKLKEIESQQMILDTKNEIKKILKPYHFKHCTIETELFGEDCGRIEP